MTPNDAGIDLVVTTKQAAIAIAIAHASGVGLYRQAIQAESHFAGGRMSFIASVCSLPLGVKQSSAERTVLAGLRLGVPELVERATGNAMQDFHAASRGSKVLMYPRSQASLISMAHVASPSMAANRAEFADEHRSARKPRHSTRRANEIGRTPWIASD